MGSMQGFSLAVTHWSFGIIILVGLVSSNFSSAEAILGVLLAGCASTLSAICSYTPDASESPKPQRTLLNFLILWLDVLSNLAAAAACARVTSASIDVLTKNHFRELLLGMEQSVLDERWPDLVGVLVILMATIIRMLGFEVVHKFSGAVLFLGLLTYFAIFTVIGSFHTVNSFEQWVDSLKLHSSVEVLRAGAFCAFAFVHKLPTTTRNNGLKIFTILFMPLLFYVVLIIVFSFMTHYKELEGTAIPLVKVFQNRDVNWAWLAIAWLTECLPIVLVIQIFPSVYFAFLRLASKEWKVFVSSIQYQSFLTGAPVLAIFPAGSLMAILAFACPLAYLLKLLNVACLLKCALASCSLMNNRYRPDVLHAHLQAFPTANVNYSKLGPQSKPVSRHLISFKERVKGLFRKTPQYIHKLSSPKGPSLTVGRPLTEEQECLLFKDVEINQAALSFEMGEGSNSETEENEMEALSASDEESSTDIDGIVEEYKEGVRVATMGSFKRATPSTKLTQLVFLVFMTVIVLNAASIALSIQIVKRYYWVEILALALCIVVISCLPENSAEKSKPSLLPSFLFPLGHSLSINANILLASMLLPSVWLGVVIWTLSGLLLYWKCDCCKCELLEPLVERVTSKVDPQHVLYQYQDSLVESIGIAVRSKKEPLRELMLVDVLTTCSYSHWQIPRRYETGKPVADLMRFAD
ncbi:hypothetical protein HUJ04_008897 [Dendroctonus ponderosae]|nr:hypothetical protein HUJ04_008897 [Dendroctonus ponderosae]